MREMSSIRYEINLMDYLHEKAQESRHKETQAYLMFLGGAIFYVGGILENLSLTKNPKWFLFIPYHTEPLGGAVLGLSLIVSGLSLMVFGIVAGSICRHYRRWYIEELRKVASKKELVTQKKSRIKN